MSGALREALVDALTRIVIARIDLEIELPMQRLNYEREGLPVAEQAARQADAEMEAAGRRSVQYVGRHSAIEPYEPEPIPDVFAIAKQAAERMADYLLRNELADRAATTARKIAAEIDKIASKDRQRRQQLERRAEAVRGELGD